MKIGISLLSMVLIFGSSWAQRSTYDSTYIEKTVDQMILRTYVSRKYTNLDYGKSVGLYEPNSGLNLGVGITYQRFTLNIAAPFGFLNPNRIEDWPQFLDLQLHSYPQNWIFDLFLQFYRGYTLSDFQDSGAEYRRRDLRLVKLGLSANYLFNGEKFSFEAAFHQSEIQKRSAFSPMLGFEVYRVRISGDSLLIPEELGVPGNYSRGDFFQIGPSAGLAGTLVFGNGFFITGAASANLGLGTGKADENKDSRAISLMPGYNLRGFAGYNGRKFSINGSYVFKNLLLAEIQGISQEANTGNYRVNLVYKIHPGPKLDKTFTKFNPRQILKRMFN
ncbi:DUF4421 domain-containing protein [Algoriphagus confluentis]|uniref:DUF4421 domain-containing protein n=1 Tax=Algoriphagus confluentis TaxID=1697556 RepID=A0ABQ6PTK6_9BACT|nr:hypothetical protein Aconfl_39630 [Algoriphagus confluentis]